jgi:RHS repeat-associated protein
VPEGAPDLALVYGSSPASSIVGAGWSLSLPGAVTIGPARGIPSWSASDGYLFGGEELVPWVQADKSRRVYVRDGVATQMWRLATNPDDVRFERRTDTTSGTVTWWSRDAGNVLTRYGEAASSRVDDPSDPFRVAAWLPTFRVDPVGRAVAFEYVGEDLRGVDQASASERGRLRTRQPQRYIKAIRFGNRQPASPDGPAPDTAWNFVLVFDYGDHDPDAPALNPDRDWTVRPDPSSSYRPGFEIRTWRRCEAVHVFQRIGARHERVATTRFIYASPTTSVNSRLIEVQQTAWRDAGARSASLPPVRFHYAEPAVDPHIGPRVEIPNSRRGLANARTRWVDLHGDGLPGVLTEASSSWWYSRNLGAGRFASPVALAERPATELSSMALGDEDQDGNIDFATLFGRGAGRYQLDRERQTWSAYQARARTAHVEGIAPRVQRVDLDGDGRPDLVVSEADHFLWYPSDAPEGLGEPRRIPKPRGARSARELGPDPALDLLFADMNGDGLPDLVRIENGRIEYWPNLGNGRFGDAVVVDDAPTFTSRDAFDIRRLRLADLTGNGCPDLLYLDGHELRWWHNLGGNRMRFGGVRRGVPSLDGLTDLRVLEIYGDGRPALVWSSAAPTAEGLAVLPLAGPVSPGRLVEIDDGSGLSVRVHWSSSGQHMLRDLLEGAEWSTHLPQHVPVVDGIDVEDRITRSVATTTFRYRDGHLDSEAREFRGFGCVDQLDVEVTQDDPLAPTSVPRLTRTWHVVGAPDEQRAACARSWDGGHIVGAPRVVGLDDPSIDAVRARRAVAGSPRRVEVYAAPGGVPRSVPLEIRTWTWQVQPAGADAPAEDRPLRVIEREQVQAIHEGEAADPRITRSLTVRMDDRGHPNLLARVGHARAHPDAPGQETGGIELQAIQVLHVDSDDRFERAIPVESRTLELLGVDPNSVRPDRLLAADVDAALAAPVVHHAVPGAAVVARLWSWQRSVYYDDARRVALPFGQVGARTFVHHESAAVFDIAWPAKIYGDRVDDARLRAEIYRVEEGYWWRDDPVQIWGSDTVFALLLGVARPDGTGPRIEYEDQVPIASTDAVGNRTESELDPYTRAPRRIVDANGLVEEVEYDPFGVITRSVRYGAVTDGGATRRWGGEPIAPSPTLTLNEALAEPEAALGTSNAACWLDLDAPQREGLPARILTLQRTRLLHDGAGSSGTPEVRVQLAYLDGTGEVVQSRLRVEPADAIHRTGSGEVAVDAGGLPLPGPTADRWLVSGFEVKNRKREVVRIHEPFFSSGASFEADEALLRLGVSTAFAYDALGRVSRVDHPDGSFERNEHTAWSVRRYDRNDAALESVWALLRSAQPEGSAPRDALERVRAHAATPTIVDLDVWGREVRVTTTGGPVANDRVNRTVYDGGGRAMQVIDARGLVASHTELDLDGEVVYRRSMDAGETWLLPDGFGRPRHRWGALGHHIETTFDAADRPLREHVRGQGLDHQVAAFAYGESVADGADRNARGRLIEVRDSAGRQTILSYDPAGAPLYSERQLREDFVGEPDWRLAVALSPERFASRAAYDALGRLVRATLPDGLLREVAWSVAGGMRSITVTAPDGTRTEVFADAEHDASGRRLFRRLGNRVTQDWSYEADTRRLARQRALFEGSTLQDLRMSYDPVGNVLRVVDMVQEPEFSGALLHGLNTSAATVYRYDPHYRLIEAQGRVHRALLRSDESPSAGSYRFSRRMPLNDGSQVERYTRTYQYDPADNLVRMHHQGVTAQWTTRTWVSAASNRSLPEHDLAGNLVSDPETRFDAAGQLVEMDHLRHVEWSWRGTLSRAVLIDRSAAEGPDDAEYYVYGADRMRVRKIQQRLANDSIETTETVYFDGCEVRRIRFGNEPIVERWTSHVHDEHGRVALIHRWTRDDLARETDDLTRARVHYFLGNTQGSAVMDLDELGVLIAYEEYFPYGGTSFIAGDNERAIALRDYRYMGKERDAGTGLSYFGHRYYAPWMFRWMSPDPVGMADGTNLYCFVRGNPSTLVDDAGLQADTATRDWRVVDSVPAHWSEATVIREFNRGAGRERGIYALDLEHRDGKWYIIDSIQAVYADVDRLLREIGGLESIVGGDGDDARSDLPSCDDITQSELDHTEGAAQHTETSTADQERQDPGAGGGDAPPTPGERDDSSSGRGVTKESESADADTRPRQSLATPATGSEQPAKRAPAGTPPPRPTGGSANRDPVRRSGAPPTPVTRAAPPGSTTPPTDTNLGRLGGPDDVGATSSLPAERIGVPDSIRASTPLAPPTPSVDGSPLGNPGDPPSAPSIGDAAGTGAENGQAPLTAFDDVVCVAGYTNFESCEGDGDGDRYGVPGGLGSIRGNRWTQGAYVAVSVVNLVLLVRSLAAGIGKLLMLRAMGARAAIAAALESGRRLLSAAGEFMRRGGARIRGALAWTWSWLRAARTAAKFDPSRAAHIFREAAGHVNPASAGSQARFARLFESVGSNPANLRPDAVQAGIITQDAANAGVQAFTQVAKSGEQIWVTVRNGLIQNAGVNPVGALR